MTDKNPEVMVCDASIMKNVWEIRLREYGQRIKLEQDRIEKSALLRINEDWAKRMSGHVKPRRVERKAKPPEELPAQTFKPKQVPLGRPSGFVSSRPQKQVDVKKDTKPTKQSKLNLLLSLNEKQPGMMVWTKAWKFSQALPQPEQMPAASDWGTAWKFLNIQPKNEGKSWMEQERDADDTNNNVTYNEALLQWEKVDKTLYFQTFEEEDLAIPDWEKSWKYTKQRKDCQSDEKTNLRQKSLDVFQQFQRYNGERSSSEWNESWKSPKPPNEEHVTFERKSTNKEDNENENRNQEEEQSTIPWGQSWKQFKKQLHLPSKSMGTSIPPAWMDSWRVSKPISPKLHQESATTRSNVLEPQVNMPEEPLDPKRYQSIMEASREEQLKSKMELWNSQLQAKDPLPVNEWQKSWMTTKNMSEYKEQPIEKMSREDKPMPMPIERQEMKKVGFGSGLQQHGQFELIPLFPKRFPKPPQITELSELSKDKEPFISRWKDSWKSLKKQRRQDRIQSRLQRMSQQAQQVGTPQTSLSGWTNSWRFTNLNLNQNSDLWQQGWATYSRNRPERWVRENDFPNNGPTSARGWGESWRSTRHQHRAEREATRTASTQRPSTQRPSTQPQPDRLETQLHQQERSEHSCSDWEQSWKFSMNEYHHDKPSSTEWADSWKFCSFHCEDWSKRQTEPNKGQWKSIVINGRKGLHLPCHMISSSFEAQVFKQRFPSKEWQNSWKMFTGKKQSKPGRDIPQSWDHSWMFNPTQFYRSSSGSDDSSSMQWSQRNLAQYESTSEWGRSWRIANIQPPKSVASWFEAEPCTCSPTYMVFWTRYKCNDCLFSLLAKEYAKLKKWSIAWRFMKLESKIDMKAAISQTTPEDDSIIIKKVMKPKKPMFSQVEKDKEASYLKRWVDACKLAKTQPRPKREVKSKPGEAKDEALKAMIAEWAESWRFASDSKTDEPVKVSVSLADWEDSWKFLLSSYAPQSSPKMMMGSQKGRS
ncbi:uncharacterized protein LOC103034687 [Astyanax mexicanus]|uniref:uncharacterized protein LOC103034687 n=1 Tax=Astyanax mexicanus TaxID=7994 RepID=UPI0020CB2DD4|nr:uncharacterized protein LOC103034687 [Astyanax mexicanus]